MRNWRNVVNKILVMTLVLAAAFQAQADTLDRTPIEATTAKGEKVMLYPTGKWEFVDVAKAAEAKKVAEQFPENKVRPVDAQGGWIPGTRTLMPGDKDYNRGSLIKR
ncbi:MAG: hypothetical protein K2X64_00700 [Rhodocyclaceae bacterium]|nr:hypothetical protein [Rhodocyclaceae bacterium]